MYVASHSYDYEFYIQAHAMRHGSKVLKLIHRGQRAETDFFSGEPLRALSTLVYSENVDLQRSASLTFAEITERGVCARLIGRVPILMSISRCARSRP